MKAVIISGGNRVKKEKVMSVMKDCDLLLCADRGTDHALSYNLIPDYVIGDMDSIDPKTFDKIKSSRLVFSSPEKDYTDTHLAVQKALESGCDKIDILCATGLRSDHALANIRLLIHIENSGSKGRIIDDMNTMYLCRDRIEFNGKNGRTVSLVSMDCVTRGITLEGFKYPLKDFEAGLDWVSGISNVIISDTAALTIESGCLLVIEVEDN
ncbi:MAG: thiamine diphosphokinase [Clostridia bacterium]|nr:thiamine diphosphokinase [Clostridia bacterium]MBN2883401.1 thiamine diphosphokinase [Clostridia bacterium]